MSVQSLLRFQAQDHVGVGKFGRDGIVDGRNVQRMARREIHAQTLIVDAALESFGEFDQQVDALGRARADGRQRSRDFRRRPAGARLP